MSQVDLSRDDPIALIHAREASRGIARYQARYPSMPWTLAYATWIQICHRCGCSAELHYHRDTGQIGACLYSDPSIPTYGPAGHRHCPRMRWRVIQHPQPTPIQVLHYIGRVLDITDPEGAT